MESNADVKFKPKTIPYGFWNVRGVDEDAPFLEDVVEWFEKEYRRTPTLKEIAICVWYSTYKARIVPYLVRSDIYHKLAVYHFFLHKYGLTPDQVDKLPIDFVLYAIERERKLAESSGGSYNGVRGATLG